MGFFMNRKIELFMTLSLLCCAIFLAREGAIYVQNSRTQSEPSKDSESTGQSQTGTGFCIVIDAGHGGKDPGKIGVNGELEKDINLTIALQLGVALSKEHVTVVYTRTEDVDLSDGATNNLKVADMQNRCRLIEDANPIFTISIHQNSYPSTEVSGAQVFYYTHSKEGELLAGILQDSLITNLDPSNRRAPKANDSYYLLKKTPTPTVIVECGFLSNPTEASLLSATEYQEKIVYALSAGILEYLKSNDYM